MVKKIMKKFGYISVKEASKYDYTLVYKIDGKSHTKKIIDYFNDDGIAFISREEEMFTLDSINTEDIKIFKHTGEVIYSNEEEKLKMNYLEKLELMSFLYADIVENRERVDPILFEDVITKFKMGTSYNLKRDIKDINDAIDFMEQEVWKNLYGKTYVEFLN